MITTRLLVLLSMLAMPAVIHAAEPVRDLAALPVKPGIIVYVRTTNGAELQGEFISATSRALTISPGGRSTSVDVDHIAQIWKRGDSLRNGAIIGAVIGVAGAIGGQSECSDCSGRVAAGIFLGAPIWAGIGALIDRQHVGRTLIYRAP